MFFEVTPARFFVMNVALALSLHVLARTLHPAAVIFTSAEPPCADRQHQGGCDDCESGNHANLAAHGAFLRQSAGRSSSVSA
jgi:hypothetical protein